MSYPSELGAVAARYAQAGWPVYPVTPDNPQCRDPGSCLCKAPLVASGFLAASTDLVKVAEWWTKWPRANIGIATGAPGPDVLDVDISGGKPGFESLRAARAAGLIPPAMAEVRSGSGGLHLYYPGTNQRCGSLTREGIDWRATGGGIIAPPSRVHGRPYQTVTQRKAGPAPCIDFTALRTYFRPPMARPPWQPRELGAGRRDLAHLVRIIAELPDGHGRGANGLVFWAFCRAYEHGADDTILDAITAAAIDRGLHRHSVEATRRSAQRTAARLPARPGRSTPLAATSRPSSCPADRSPLDAGR